MDFNHWHDWVHLLLRWGHFLAGIMWIGTSLYFVWMDSSFEPLAEPKKGIDGELWMVHGGNFYHVEKRRFGAGEMPKNLHWFKWEATLTWITGFVLLVWVYYLTNGAYLIDPRISSVTPTQASLIGLGVLVGGWIFYDGLYRSPLSKYSWINIFTLIFLGGVAYGLTHLLSGRAAYIHIGALFGTMMVLNVWVHILPNQQKIIDASMQGIDPDYELGIKAKRRSMHNSYMTLPVLFIMISNHFPSTFSHKYNFVILLLMIALGAFLRHFMITLKKWPLVLASGLLLVLFVMTKPQTINAAFMEREISFAKDIQPILSSRCLRCHSSNPSDEEFTEAPMGVKFEQPESIKMMAHKIFERVYVQQDMPLQNKTGMTEEERMLMAAWIKKGAATDN